MRSIPLLVAGSILAGCAPAPPPPVGEQAQVQLARELQGFVAGQPQSCIQHYQADNQMTIIDDNTILFEASPTLIYRNELMGVCSGLDAGHTLILRSTGSSLCRGEIGEVTDLRTGVTFGSCALGDFIPYRRP